MSDRGLALVASVGLFGWTSCVVEDADLSSTGDYISFEEFEATTTREPWEGGVYIVDGDIPIADIDELEAFWAERYVDGALLVDRVGGVDNKWSTTNRKNLTYCIRSGTRSPLNWDLSSGTGAFGASNSADFLAVRDAMAAAAADWESAANVDFIYDATNNATCSGSTSSVMFDVRLVDTTGDPYGAYWGRAFFPNDGRINRNVLIDVRGIPDGPTGPETLTGLLRHELGHALGFRHEHTRYTSNSCYEDGSWRELTTYDAASVMHYPECNGTNTGDLVLTSKDIAGAQALYGWVKAESGSAPVNGWKDYAYPVAAGHTVAVTTTGTGDADLYIQWNTFPTTSSYACRSVGTTSTESCTLVAPASATTVYVSIYGYATNTFSLTARQTIP